MGLVREMNHARAKILRGVVREERIFITSADTGLKRKWLLGLVREMNHARAKILRGVVNREALTNWPISCYK